jgi:hypothetical protein
MSKLKTNSLVAPDLIGMSAILRKTKFINEEFKIPTNQTSKPVL